MPGDPLHERTVAIQRSLQTRERAPLAHFDSRRYIQHNLSLGDGLGPILAFMDSLPADATRVDALRAFTDGDYSVAHLAYELGDWGPMVGFEVHRWEQDRIVEHWDNLQPLAAQPNPSGHTMIDGETGGTDGERGAGNKALAGAFVADGLIGGDRDLMRRLLASDLTQHAPELSDGAEEMLAAVGAGYPTRYRHLHKVLGHGDLVLTMSDGTRDGKEVSIYDLWRVSDGQLVERWPVVETIPARAEWQNANGKF